MEKAIFALRKQEWSEAEAHLREALTIQPEHPSLLNNLALALFQQDKTEEGEQVLKHVMEDFPDYFFGQMSLAHHFIREKQYEKARAILNAWMERKERYHTSEFVMLCKAHINLLIAEGEVEGTRSWLKLWEATGSDAPEFAEYEKHLEALSRASGRRKAIQRYH